MKVIDKLHVSMGVETIETKDVCGMSVPSIKHIFGKVRKHCGRSKECDVPMTVPDDTISRAPE